MLEKCLADSKFNLGIFELVSDSKPKRTNGFAQNVSNWIRKATQSGRERAACCAKMAITRLCDFSCLSWLALQSSTGSRSDLRR